ncbi:MAG: DUF6273 domain-containing protein [bacterium]|nr:DUF6273 domain-containing protein [bacterium]
MEEMNLNRKLKIKLEKIMSYMLAVTMIAGSISLSPLATVEVQAAVETRNVNLRLSDNSIAGIGNPDSTATTAWKGTTVYFGNRAYYVLDKDGTAKDKANIGDGHSSKSGHMLLLLKGVIDDQNRYFDRINGNGKSDWSISDIRNDLNGGDFLNKSGEFTDNEKEAIGVTTIRRTNTDNGGYIYYPSNDTDDKIFLLDLNDVQNTNYGFVNDIDGTDTRSAAPNCTFWWWLRSSGSDEKMPAFVFPDGTVGLGGRTAGNEAGSARPALNLDLSKVLFSSASGFNKSNYLAETTGASATGTQWVLTLAGGTGFTATRKSGETGAVKAGEKMHVDVTNIGSKNTGVAYNQLSAMLVDGNQTVVAYGQVKDTDETDNNLEVTIPSDIKNGTYTMKVFAEQVSVGNKTDYASNMESINLEIKSRTVPIPTSTPIPTPDQKDDKEEQPASNPKKNEETFINPLAWNYPMNQSGSLCTIEEQGAACKLAFAAATPAGFREAFSFNLYTKENGALMKSYSKKAGKFTLNIPKEYQKPGRTFMLVGMGKDGKIKTYTDEDLSDGSITITLDLEGYAFSLIYTDEVVSTTSTAGQGSKGENVYIVQKGDVLSRIAKNLGVSRPYLTNKNNLTNPNQIKIGQKLYY